MALIQTHEANGILQNYFRRSQNITRLYDKEVEMDELNKTAELVKQSMTVDDLGQSLAFLLAYGSSLQKIKAMQVIAELCQDQSCAALLPDFCYLFSYHKGLRAMLNLLVMDAENQTVDNIVALGVIKLHCHQGLSSRDIIKAIEFFVQINNSEIIADNSSTISWALYVFITKCKNNAFFYCSDSLVHMLLSVVKPDLYDISTVERAIKCLQHLTPSINYSYDSVLDRIRLLVRGETLERLLSSLQDCACPCDDFFVVISRLLFFHPEYNSYIIERPRYVKRLLEIGRAHV